MSVPTEWPFDLSNTRFRYFAKIEILNQMAGRPYQTWNTRFRELMTELGLRLSLYRTQEYQVTAPYSTRCRKDNWKPNQYIVE